jgi:hypothetical protein
MPPLREAGLEDFRRVIELASRCKASGVATHEVLRMTLHPEDFLVLRRCANAATQFTSYMALGKAGLLSVAAFEPTPTQNIGSVWGVQVYVDPRSDRGFAYIVTVDKEHCSKQQTGESFRLVLSKTSWDMVLDDDLIGVDSPHEMHSGGSLPLGREDTDPFRGGA